MTKHTLRARERRQAAEGDLLALSSLPILQSLLSVQLLKRSH